MKNPFYSLARFFKISIFLFLLTHLLPTDPALAVDYNIYAGLLKKYVKSGVVDYSGLKGQEPALDQFLRILEVTDVKTLSRNERFAFYINVYNAWTLKLILDNYPGVKSIKDLGGIISTPWKKNIVKLAEGTITLDDVEHKILRPQFKDPRIHFAVNCASKSCPILISEPYLPEKLDRQLDSSTRNFLNNPKRNYLKGDTLHVSKIFKWYKKDFKNGVAGFFLQYADKELRDKIERQKDKLKIAYLKYDWSLNGK